MNTNLRTFQRDFPRLRRLAFALTFTVVTGSFLASAFAAVASTPPASPAIPDPRHLANGRIIPSEGYADQPYVVPTADGAWLCVITTGTASGESARVMLHVS